MTGIFVVNDADRGKFLKIVSGHPWVEVAGDTKYDTVLERAGEIKAPSLPGIPPREKRSGPGRVGAMVLVAGSTWAEDERVILPSLLEMMGKNSALRLIIAPHEIAPSQLERIESQLRDFPVIRFSALAGADNDVGLAVGRDGESSRVIVVDSVGHLAALYALADVAYVGGGFGAGVHNVLEPAVMSVPALFGPRHGNAPEAGALLAAGGAFEVGDASSFHHRLLGLLDDSEARNKSGHAARGLVESKAGASQIAFQRIRSCLH